MAKAMLDEGMESCPFLLHRANRPREVKSISPYCHHTGHYTNIKGKRRIPAKTGFGVCSYRAGVPALCSSGHLHSLRYIIRSEDWN